MSEQALYYRACIPCGFANVFNKKNAIDQGIGFF